MADNLTAATFTRRRAIQMASTGALALGLGGPLSALARPHKHHHHHHRHLRRPDSVPFPQQPVGEFTGALPFDHLIVLMMENHSFDCYFGMLPHLGQPRADGFTFDPSGRPSNRNPYEDGHVVPYRATSECQGSVTQSWNSTHQQIDGGRMDGFAKTDLQSMVYWTDGDLPFYYSLAKHFTLANRWFCSAPCQTYPNRRFLMAGTAYGNISTDNASLQDPPPPNGTIFDRLSAHNIGWRNYFTDLPATGIIPSTIEKYPSHITPISNFFSDCASGNLPAVSFVDPEFGAAGEVGGPIDGLPLPSLPHLPGTPPASLGGFIGAQGGSEENPQNIQIGQAFCDKVINAVLNSPAWHRTLLIWTYDEHGGYYDHVPPPAAIKPDNIPPKLGPNDAPGGYDIYGPRVPTVVVSPHSRPGGVSNKVFDHTSVLATIEHQWNLPACTYRDANARTVADFLDRKNARLLNPPSLAAAQNPLLSEPTCSTDEPPVPVQH